MKRENLGIFYVDLGVIQDNPQLIADMFQTVSMIIVRAEMMFSSNAIEYMAMCDQFALVAPGCSPPRYEVQLSTRQIKKNILLPGDKPDATIEVFKAVRFVKEGWKGMEGKPNASLH